MNAAVLLQRISSSKTFIKHREIKSIQVIIEQQQWLYSGVKPSEISESKTNQHNKTVRKIENVIMQ